MQKKITVPRKVQKEVIKSDEEKEAEETQQKLVLYQLFQQRLEQIQKELLLLQQQMLEIETSKQAVSDMKTAKENNEILIPVGSGCYASGKLSRTDKLLVDIGANVMTRKTVGDAFEGLEKNGREVERTFSLLQLEMNNIATEMNRMLPELQKIARQHEHVHGAGSS